MQGHSLGTVMEKNTQSHQTEYRAPVAFWSPAPLKQGPSLWGRKLSRAQAHSLCPHQDRAEPKHGTGKSFQCWYDSWTINWTGLLHGLSGSDWHSLPRTEGVSTVSEATNEATLEELEEGGIRWKGTCKSELLFGENTVHALWQSSGIRGRPWHRGAQNQFPASRWWEVGHRVLPSLLWEAHSLQLLLWWSHGCSPLSIHKQLVNDSPSMSSSCTDD